MKIPKKCYNPCDDCQYGKSKQNQESGICLVCEFKKYRDAEEQGLLLKLPCKVGDAVYSLECGIIVRDFVHSFSTDANGLWAIDLYGGIIGLFGLSVFATLEEALAKMKEGV